MKTTTTNTCRELSVARRKRFKYVSCMLLLLASLFVWPWPKCIVAAAAVVVHAVDVAVLRLYF